MSATEKFPISKEDSFGLMPDLGSLLKQKHAKEQDEQIFIFVSLTPQMTSPDLTFP